VAQVLSLRKTVAAYRQRGFDTPGWAAASAEEHACIVEAICRGGGSDAQPHHRRRRRHA
jgi:hypothetical protein